MAGKTRTVRQGECILSIAYEEGQPWDRVWNDPANRTLKDQRKQPGILLPGDSVSIPEPRLRQEKGKTEEKHRFRMRSAVELRIRIHSLDGRPRTDDPYHVEIGTRRYPGTTKKTDQEGLCVVRVPANVTEMTLVVGENEDLYRLRVGYLDPVDRVTGQHARLENMGFFIGGVDTPHGTATTFAMTALLREAGKDPSKYHPEDPDDPPNHDFLSQEYGV